MGSPSFFTSPWVPRNIQCWYFKLIFWTVLSHPKWWILPIGTYFWVPSFYPYIYKGAWVVKFLTIHLCYLFSFPHLSFRERSRVSWSLGARLQGCSSSSYSFRLLTCSLLHYVVVIEFTRVILKPLIWQRGTWTPHILWVVPPPDPRGATSTHLTRLTLSRALGVGTPLARTF